jgi:hypothetical protein
MSVVVGFSQIFASSVDALAIVFARLTNTLFKHNVNNKKRKEKKKKRKEKKKQENKRQEQTNCSP